MNESCHIYLPELMLTEIYICVTNYVSQRINESRVTCICPNSCIFIHMLYVTNYVSQRICVTNYVSQRINESQVTCICPNSCIFIHMLSVTNYISQRICVANYVSQRINESRVTCICPNSCIFIHMLYVHGELYVTNSWITHATRTARNRA